MKLHFHLCLLAFLVIAGYSAHGQGVIPKSGDKTKLEGTKGWYEADSGLIIPNYNAKKSPAGTAFNKSGRVWFDKLGDSAIHFFDGVRENQILSTKDKDLIVGWSVTGSDAQTLSLSTNQLSITNGNTITLPFTFSVAFIDSVAAHWAAIMARVKYTDTSGMLTPYLRSAIAAASYQTTTGANATYTQVQIDIHDSVKGKMPLSDSTRFLKVGDTSSQFNTVSNVASRDANGNIHANNFESAFIQIGASGTKTLTNASERHQYFANGTGTATVILPVATTMHNGHVFELNQNGVGTLTIKNASGTTLFTLPTGGYAYLILTNNGTTAGVWDWHFELPKTASFGTSGLTMPGNITADTVTAKVALSNIYPPPSTGTVTSIAAGTGLSGGTITTSGTISMPSVGTSGTFAYPASITTDAQGRVSAITGGSAPTNGTVTNIATGFGLSGGPITGTGTIVNDSIVMATRARLQKVADSLGAVLATKGNGTVTSITGGFGLTGGTITNSGAFGIDSVIMATRARVQKAIDSLNVIIATKGSGTVTNVIAGTNIAITGTSTIQPTVSISGTIAMSNGGTGTTTQTSVNGVPIAYGSNNTLPIGTGTVTNVIGGTNITITGTSTVQPTVNLSGTIAVANGGTGATSSTTINGQSIAYGTTNTITAAASTLTGSTLASGVTGTSITSTGTVTGGTWNSTIGTSATATTATAGDNSDKVATTAFVYRLAPADTTISANYTLTSRDAGRKIHCTNVANINVTIPTGLSTSFSCIFIQEKPLGTVTFLASSTTLNFQPTGATKTKGIGAQASVSSFATADNFSVTGALN